MKLHDLRPADGSTRKKTRVGRGIAAGKGKTAGRGTKGQKARAGGSIPPWFEGGQTPLHMRIPKLRGFKNRFKVEYEVVNVGAIGALAEKGAFTPDKVAGGKKAETITVNQDILRAVGLVRTLSKPLKILGNGELTTGLFVVADAFTASARQKIEAAGGTVSVLETPTTATAALGVGEDGEDGQARAPRERRTAAGRAAEAREVADKEARQEVAAERVAEAEAAAAKPAKAPKAKKAEAVAATEEAPEAAPTESVGEADVNAPAAEAATADAPADEPDATTETSATDDPTVAADEPAEELGSETPTDADAAERSE